VAGVRLQQQQPAEQAACSILPWSGEALEKLVARETEKAGLHWQQLSFVSSTGC
jgi:hypothetical protein